MCINVCSNFSNMVFSTAATHFLTIGLKFSCAEETDDIVEENNECPESFKELLIDAWLIVRVEFVGLVFLAVVDVWKPKGYGLFQGVFGLDVEFIAFFMAEPKFGFGVSDVLLEEIMLILGLSF